MDILGIGLPELFFIVIIALIILGPGDMVKAGRTLGGWLRAIMTSDWWMGLQRGLRELRKLPYQMAREAGVEEDLKQFNETAQEARSILGPQAMQAWIAEQKESGQTIAPPTQAPQTPTAKPGEPAPAAKDFDLSAWTGTAKRPTKPAGQEANTAPANRPPQPGPSDPESGQAEPPSI